jgi:hypothetical protein
MKIIFKAYFHQQNFQNKVGKSKIVWIRTTAFKFRSSAQLLQISS